MKTSHYTTPRSLEACQFAHDADPMDYAPRGIDYQDRIVFWGCAIAVVLLGVILYVA
jgi:hypothetical protein